MRLPSTLSTVGHFSRQNLDRNKMYQRKQMWVKDHSGYNSWSTDLDGVIPSVVFTLKPRFSCSYLPLICLTTNQNIQLIHSLLIRIEWTTGNRILMSSSHWPIYNKLYLELMCPRVLQMRAVAVTRRRCRPSWRPSRAASWARCRPARPSTHPQPRTARGRAARWWCGPPPPPATSTHNPHPSQVRHCFNLSYPEVSRLSENLWLVKDQFRTISVMAHPFICCKCAVM